MDKGTRKSIAQLDLIPIVYCIVYPRIQKLLIVQEADMAAHIMESRVKMLPEEIKILEEKIVAEKQAIESAKKTFQALEVRRKEIDVQVQSTEDDLIKYKTQQISVKKTDAYEALNQEIQHAQEKIHALEDEELQLLLDIDTVKEKFERDEKNHKASIEKYQQEIAKIKNELEEAKKQSDDLRKKFDDAFSALAPELQSTYLSVKSSVKRAPYIVMLKNHHCQGCFLKVANEAESGTLDANATPRCGNCSRILYLEAK